MSEPAKAARRHPRPTAAARPGVSIMTVDDHPIVLQGLRELLSHESDMSVCVEAEDARAAIAAAREHQPDVAIVDLTLKDVGGLELIKQLHAILPDLRIIVMSMHDENLYAERALRAGARGYLMKQEGTERLVDAIRTVMAGGIFVSERMASRMLGKYLGSRTIEPKSPVERLSDREIEVFELIGRGNSTRQIAERLCVSIKTVESHREHIKQKLKLSTATELVQHATQWVMSGEGDGSAT